MKTNIENLLFSIDPMGTHCKFYNSYDEYSEESQEISVLIQNGVPMHIACRSVFIKYFGSDLVKLFSAKIAAISLTYYNHTV